MSNKSRNFILDSLSKTLPDDRPITSLQIIENLEKCPTGFHPIRKTYDQDQDADLWRESGGFLKRKSVRYLCVSKTEGLPNFVLEKIEIIQEKAIPPEGFSLLHKTADTEQKAWRKRQLCYKIRNCNSLKAAVTDIIICSRLKKPPEGFHSAGEINGVLICYKMGNVESNGINPNSVPPERPPKPNVYPSLNDGGDHDYEILNPPGYVPSRPAPKPPSPSIPFAHQNSTHNTLSSGLSGLEGVPFVLNPKFSAKSEKLQLPVIKARTLNELMEKYNYDFRLERQQNV